MINWNRSEILRPPHSLLECSITYGVAQWSSPKQVRLFLSRIGLVPMSRYTLLIPATLSLDNISEGYLLRPARFSGSDRRRRACKDHLPDPPCLRRRRLCLPSSADRGSSERSCGCWTRSRSEGRRWSVSVSSFERVFPLDSN